MGKNVLERFWKKVNKTETCWIWIAATDGRGYGKFCPKHGKYVIASRFSWELHNGPIPEGMFICHKCDNPLCINPKHLFLGTAKDNMQDMKLKNRHEYRVGSHNPNAKLTENDVLEIRNRKKNGESAKKLSNDFNVVIGTIYNLCNPNQKAWSGRRGMH